MPRSFSSRRYASATVSTFKSRIVLDALSRIDIFGHLLRRRVRRRQRELHAGVDLALHVREDPLERVAIDELLIGEPLHERLERIALRHPLLFFFARAVLAI